MPEITRNSEKIRPITTVLAAVKNVYLRKLNVCGVSGSVR
jgi:hypothetical protein